MNAPTVVGPGVIEQVRGNLVMRADQIRTANTGIHATLKLYGLRDGRRRFLAGTTCNVTRDEERTKLINTARRQATPEYEEMLFGPADTKVLMKRDFDIFCFAIYDTLMAVEEPSAVTGEMLGPMQFVAKPHVLSNSGTILFGPGGSGKSTTAFLLAVAVDSGTNGIWATAATPTLYINLERSADSIIRRIFAVNSALGLDPDRPLNVLNARGKSLTSLEPIIRKFVEEHGIKFLILDSISRTGIGKLTEDDTANMLINMLNSFGCAWLAIGHTSKENKDETFGSVHYGNGADITAALSSEKRGALETGVRIEVKKANDIAFPAPMTLQYTFDEEYGLHTARLAGAEEYPELEARPPSAGEAVYQWLLNDAGRGTATMAAKATGFQRAAITKVFERDPRFTRVEQIGVEVFYGVKHDVRHSAT